MPVEKDIVVRTLSSGELAPFAKKSTCSGLDLITQLYHLRGYCVDEHSVNVDQQYDLRHLLPPTKMKGLNLAAQRLAHAIESSESVLIVGDFDADGATSTALAVRVLRAFGLEDVQYLVPNRFEFGYGLTPEIVDVAASLSPRLIVTVDNGIASVDGVATANNYGIDVIVTDHHLPPRVLPSAYAIVNPNQHGCEFESKNLAGVGVIFYVLCAVRRELDKRNWFDNNKIPMPNMATFLDLVSLGTVADVVPLDFNNRVLVEQGLKRMRAGVCCAGIKALFHVAAKEISTAASQDLGFVAGPRLNAAGRLDDMSLGIDLLLTDTMPSAIQKAAELDSLNKERRQIEASMQAEADVLLASSNEVNAVDGDSVVGVCLYQADWHQGVIGILASRIKDKLYKPTIVFAQVSDTEIKGSGRSVAGVHLRDVLDAVATSNPGLLTRFGGHAMAAGLTLNTKDLPAFKKAFNLSIEASLGGKALVPSVQVDGALPAALMSLPVANLIAQAGPWGQAFPEPLFCNDFEVVSNKIVGLKHGKFVLTPLGGGQLIDAIVFNVDVTLWPVSSGTRIKLAYSLDVNTFRGVSSVQLRGAYLALLT